MRIVCDANILVRAALHANGPARAILELASLPPHALVTSDPILEEVREVLGYARIRERYGLTDSGIDAFVALLSQVSDVASLPPSIPAICADPDDDIVIATAIAGGAMCSAPSTATSSIL